MNIQSRKEARTSGVWYTGPIPRNDQGVEPDRRDEFENDDTQELDLPIESAPLEPEPQVSITRELD